MYSIKCYLIIETIPAKGYSSFILLDDYYKVNNRIRECLVYAHAQLSQHCEKKSLY